MVLFFYIRKCVRCYTVPGQTFSRLSLKQNTSLFNLLTMSCSRRKLPVTTRAQMALFSNKLWIPQLLQLAQALSSLKMHLKSWPHMRSHDPKQPHTRAQTHTCHTQVYLSFRSLVQWQSGSDLAAQQKSNHVTLGNLDRENNKSIALIRLLIYLFPP